MKYATPKDLIPEPCAVLGTVLRPFSLGQHLLLTRLDSPFAGKPAADSSPEEFALAVFLCAAPYAQSADAILRGELRSEFQRWARTLKVRWWQRPRFQQAAEQTKFSEHLARGYAKPPLWYHTSINGVTLSSPWECLLLARLARGGFEAAAVLEMYLPAAKYLDATLAELGQLEHCDKPANWRKIFYTIEDEWRLHPERFN